MRFIFYLCFLLSLLYYSEAKKNADKAVTENSSKEAVAPRDAVKISGADGRSYAYTGSSNYDNYGPEPGPAPYQQYGQPVYSSVYYPPPDYDQNYCSVHASYPLTGDDRRNCKKNSSCEDRSSEDSSRRRRSRHSRRRSQRWERQSCRFTAVFSQKTCQTCCRIASRSGDSDPASISGALFVFKPWDVKSGEHKRGRDGKVAQCVCCSPKK